MSEELLTAIIGAAGVCITALGSAFIAWRRLSLERKKTELAESELTLQRDALSFTTFMADWQNTSREMLSLIENTEIDRILILRAWNGTLDPKWTTAFYQMREAGQEPIQYVHFELDRDYVDRLQHIVARSNLYFRVEDIPDSAIKAVYQAEGVKASYWAHLQSESVPGKATKAISYMSFATHSCDEISQATQTRCLIMAGRLKGIAEAFEK